jgi:hypothetical protein
MRRMFKIFKLRRVRPNGCEKLNTERSHLATEFVSKKAYRTRRNTRVRQIITIAVYHSPEGMRSPSIRNGAKKIDTNEARAAP